MIRERLYKGAARHVCSVTMAFSTKLNLDYDLLAKELEKETGTPITIKYGPVNPHYFRVTCYLDHTESVGTHVLDRIDYALSQIEERIIEAKKQRDLLRLLDEEG
jgi:hypothetical protein